MGFEIKRKATQKQLLTKSSAHKKQKANETVLAAVVSSPAIANDLKPKLVVEEIAIADLKPAERRSRKPSPTHVANVVRCITALGVVAPVLVDAEGRIIDGHVVVEAAKQLGHKDISAIRLDHLNQEQARLARIALNKLSEGSVWDLEELRFDLQAIELAGYDLQITGFSLPELDIILQDTAPAALEAENPELLEPPVVAVSRLGDLWEAGKHRILCGDALKPESYALVLNQTKAHAAFTDAPYNIPIKGFVSAKHDDFQMGVGEMSDEAFQAFCDNFTQLITDFLEDGAVLFSCIDWRSLNRIVAAGQKAGLKHLTTATWNKGSGGMGGLYRSASEFIPVFCKGKGPKTNNVQLGKHGRDRTNVWSYPGANQPGSSAGKALKHHPTPKPIELVEDALMDVSNRGETVLDCFLGSGTTLLAAERSGRDAAGIELDPKYVDVCIRRWEEMTGKEAVLASTGQTFSEVAEIRAQGEPETQGEKTNVS